MIYSQNDKILIWLDMFNFLTYHKKKALLSSFNSPLDFYTNFSKNYMLLEKIITQTQFAEMCKCQNEKLINQYLLGLESKGIQIVSCYSNLFPQEYKEQADYPFVLYCKGDVSLLNKVCVGIVGTRKVSRYGIEQTERFARELSTNDIVIVSGMAEGVDTFAHKSTLKSGGKTIAVLGSGFDNIYPTTNIELSKEIVKNGLLITEYPPDIKPLAYNFPVRNRIIAGISKAVIITEAGIKSGALYTKNYCLDYNIEVFCVPGNVDRQSSEGCNIAIKNGECGMALSPNDVLEYLNISKNINVEIKKNVQISIEEQLILDIIGQDEVHFDEIQEKSMLSTQQLNFLLTTMELSGIIKKLAGNFFCK